MKRLIIIVLFWTVGFIGGVSSYFLLPYIVNFFNHFIPNLFSKYSMEAIIAGLIGSGISTIAILFWANKSSKEF